MPRHVFPQSMNYSHLVPCGRRIIQNVNGRVNALTLFPPTAVFSLSPKPPEHLRVFISQRSLAFLESTHRCQNVQKTKKNIAQTR
jgi:hypothetical protein